jgi:hypothetical protein
MTPGELQDYPLDADLVDAAGRLGDEFAWRLSDGRNVVSRLAASHRAARCPMWGAQQDRGFEGLI